ncbi:hypothetical protein [Paracraurococcus lichenis]|uniref:Uncharacterized protein n=1 Tax=Paracraurococcus lichenis TaxID=3064888 RepID=A0ABT9E1Z2_9PROT|nr:hypothetical protein [Paracraurococcus sp. LOR1-02]MDO9710159.1 hypothetical protein [Paracraurococcus sp. LOR1-02]
MRPAIRATLLATGLLAFGLPPVASRAQESADSATIPGARRTGEAMQRPMAENPDMKPFMSAAPARPAAAPGGQVADLGGLLRRAETEISANRLREADADLSGAQTALVQASSAGRPVPSQAMGALNQARQDLQAGRTAEALRETDQVLAQLR